jgi:hypothetical protein
MKSDTWPPDVLATINELFDAMIALGIGLDEVLDEANRLLIETGELLDKGAEPGHPQRMAEYAVLAFLQFDFMQRSTNLLPVPRRFLEDMHDFDATGKIANLREAMRHRDPDIVRNVFEPETAGMVLSDNRVIDNYLPMIKLVVSSGCIAPSVPIYYARDVFAAYLGRTLTGTDALQAGFAIFKSVAFDYLAKSNPILGPFIGPVVALTEALKEHSERRLNQLTQGIEERDRFLSLQSALEAGSEMLTASEAIIASCIKQNKEADEEFDRAVTRMRKVAEILAGN